MMIYLFFQDELNLMPLYIFILINIFPSTSRKKTSSIFYFFMNIIYALYEYHIAPHFMYSLINESK